MEPTTTCRICLDDQEAPGDEFCSPCDCRGTQAFVHRSCLRQWCQVSKTGNCEVCCAPMKLPSGPIVVPDRVKSTFAYWVFVAGWLWVSHAMRSACTGTVNEMSVQLFGMGLSFMGLSFCVAVNMVGHRRDDDVWVLGAGLACVCVGCCGALNTTLRMHKNGVQ